ncbi:MAG: hypothetical protein ACYC6Y_22615, partial [Thermoguttaceae bacterium]
VWVYWSKDLNQWSTDRKAVVLDGKNCTWSRKCIGLPSVVQVIDRLAIVYDAPGGDRKSHMNRDVGLAWLDLPLRPPATPDGAALPPDRRRTATNITAFTADSPLMPSGLLGPVTLQTAPQ